MENKSKSVIFWKEENQKITEENLTIDIENGDLEQEEEYDEEEEFNLKPKIKKNDFTGIEKYSILTKVKPRICNQYREISQE